MRFANRLSPRAVALALAALAAPVGCATTSSRPAPPAQVAAPPVEGAQAPAVAGTPAVSPAPAAAPVAPQAPPSVPPPSAAAAPAAAPGAKVDLPPVTAPTAQRHPGKIVWYDLLTLDPAAAERFYGGVMGWTFAPQGGTYTLVQQRGIPFAGIVKMPDQGGHAPQARWVPLVSIGSLDAAVAAVKRQGGKVLEGPGTLGARGRYAAIADSRGAQVVLLDPATGDPPDAATAVPGWIWAELWTDDPIAAAAFYEGVVGYKVQQEGSGKSAVWTFSSEDRPRTRAAKMPFDKVSAQWIPYAGVPDLRTALARVKELGGRVIQTPSKSVGQGTLAVVADPGGAVLVIQQRPDAEPVAGAAAAASAASDPYGIDAAQRQAQEDAAAQAGVAGADASAVVVAPAPAPVVPYVGFWFAPSPWWGWWGAGWWGPGWVGPPPGWAGGAGWWRPYPPGGPGHYPPGTYPPGYRPAPPRTPGYRPAPPVTRPPGAPAVRGPGGGSPGYRPSAPAPRSSGSAPSGGSSRSSAPSSGSSRSSSPSPAPRR
jgi:predicted enzyme related to lactoylglutathione lyase